MVCANFIEARRTHILRKQAGYMEAILSLSFGLLSLAKREETIYGDLDVPKSTRQRDNHYCPGRPASVPLRHTFVNSALATQHSLK